MARTKKPADRELEERLRPWEELLRQGLIDRVKFEAKRRQFAAQAKAAARAKPARPTGWLLPSQPPTGPIYEGIAVAMAPRPRTPPPPAADAPSPTAAPQHWIPVPEPVAPPAPPTPPPLAPMPVARPARKPTRMVKRVAAGLVLGAALLVAIYVVLLGAPYGQEARPDGNDRQGSATPIFPGANGPYHIEPTGDVDWYQFTTLSTRMVELRVTDVTGPVRVDVYSSADENVGSIVVGAGDDAALFLGAIPAGVYYVSVEQDEGTEPVPAPPAFTSYWLELRVDVPDGNDEAGSATPVPLGNNGPFSLRPATDVDWYRFTLDRGGVIRIETRGPSPGDTVIWLYDASGRLLSHDDDNGTGSYSQIVRNLTAGDYLLEIIEYEQNSVIETYYLELYYLEYYPELSVEAAPAAASRTQANEGSAMDAAKGERCGEP